MYVHVYMYLAQYCSLVIRTSPLTPSAPSAPLFLTYTPGGVLNDSISLRWLPPQHPNGVVRFYQVQLVFTRVGEPLLANTADNTTTLVLSGLTPGTQYNFSVRAFTVAFGPFSNQLTLHTADGEDMQHHLRQEGVPSCCIGIE